MLMIMSSEHPKLRRDLACAGSPNPHFSASCSVLFSTPCACYICSLSLCNSLDYRNRCCSGYCYFAIQVVLAQQGLRQQRASNIHQKQANSQTKAANGTYIRHRQTSRLANRFQQRQDDDAEDSLAEEFDEWRASRAYLKQKSQI